MSIRTAVLSACLLLLAGCATAPPTIAANASLLSGFSGRTLQSVTQKPPPLMPLRASSAMLGIIGGLSEASAAETYAQAHGIVDPAGHIEQRLSALLHERYGMNVAPAPLDLTAATQSTPYPTDPNMLFVDAKTYYWMESYFSANWGRFRFNYNTLIQIIDGANGHVIAQYDCRKVAPEHPDNAPTLAELESNNGEVANRILTGMADQCLAEFESTVLGIGALGS